MADTVTSTPNTRKVARTRGAASGVLLVLLGAWAGLAPFVGPLFDFGFTPNKAWHWTAARGWYEVAPGAVIVVGGLLLLAGTGRVLIATGAWLAIIAGGWLVVGPAVSAEATLGSLGTPLGTSGAVRALERMAFFYLLGAVVIFLASAAFGRLSVVTVRDVRVAEQREAARLEAEQAREREELEREAMEREVQQRRAAEREAYERQQAERAATEHDRSAYDRSAYDRSAYDRSVDDRSAYDRSVDDRTTRRDEHSAAPDGNDVAGTDHLGQQRYPDPQQGPVDQRGYAADQPQQQAGPVEQQRDWQAPPPR